MIAAGQGFGAPRGDGPRIRVPTEAGAVEAVTLLLDRGVPINATNKAGNTALHGSVSRGDAVVKLLLDRGAKIVKNNAGLTPLDIAKGAGGGRGGAAAASCARAPRRCSATPTARSKTVIKASRRSPGSFWLSDFRTRNATPGLGA